MFNWFSNIWCYHVFHIFSFFFCFCFHFIYPYVVNSFLIGVPRLDLSVSSRFGFYYCCLWFTRKYNKSFPILPLARDWEYKERIREGFVLALGLYEKCLAVYTIHLNFRNETLSMLCLSCRVESHSKVAVSKQCDFSFLELLADRLHNEACDIHGLTSSLLPASTS